MSHQAGDAQALRDAAHFLVRNFLGLTHGVVDGADEHFFEDLRIVWIEGGGIDFDGGDSAVTFGNDFDRAAAPGGGCSRAVRVACPAVRGRGGSGASVPNRLPAARSAGLR